MKTFALGIVALLLLTGCAAVPLVSTGVSTGSTTGSKTGATTVSITGGLETDPADGGRPVVLVAAALGVPTEVFRTAFSGVSPAGAGNDVSAERAQSNKAELLAVLAPYGITNDQLDAASNFYRYNGSAGETWAHEDATATFSDGVVTITNPGYGYSSPPTITLSTGQTATAVLAFGTDTATNGSIASITLD